jgi:hypothetical protein
MNIHKNMLVLGLICIMVLTVSYSFAETETMECSPDEVFEACDKDKDSKITKEEWNTIDTDKDGLITHDDWDKYKYKSTGQKTTPFQIHYYDVYGDGIMDKEEFYKQFKRTQ